MTAREHEWYHRVHMWPDLLLLRLAVQPLHGAARDLQLPALRRVEVLYGGGIG